MDEVNVVIIGAGVVGLAIAEELSKKIDDICILEQHDSFGKETSSRNSEVIHSGIYYPSNTLKAKLCVEGAQLLYDFCEKNSIPYKKLGKLIVAKNKEELGIIENFYVIGKQNGVKKIELLEKKELIRFGNSFYAEAAIHLPETGIIDSHSLMKYLSLESQKRGALIAYNSKVTHINKHESGYQITVAQGKEKLSSRVVINCAGLASDKIATAVGIDVKSNNYKLYFCKGSYFYYSKKYPIPLLIYPAPHKELVGLGVHATLDLNGRLRFGPDTEYVDTLNYIVDEKKRDNFFNAAISLFPNLEKDSFFPDMAGIRPKLSGPNQSFRDFIISHEIEKGFPGFINLIGIESPGLTSSLAIAKMVSEMVFTQLN